MKLFNGSVIASATCGISKSLKNISYFTRGIMGNIYPILPREIHGKKISASLVQLFAQL